MARCAVLVLLLLLAGCGGGSSAGPTPAEPSAGLRLVEERHPNGQLAAQGTVLDEAGAARRHGAWRIWFPSGQLRWQGEYRRDAIDRSRPWREWNEDGSIRDDAADGE